MGNFYCEVVNKHSTKVSKMAASRSSTSAKRFANFDDKEYDEILQNKDAQTTKKATKQAVTIFREYVMEKGVDVDIQTVDKKALALILAKFYVEVLGKLMELITRQLHYTAYVQVLIGI